MNTKPGAWAVGVILLLIVFLPVYLVVRVRYKRLLAARRTATAYRPEEGTAGPLDSAGTWPPPPNTPVA